jgi:N-acetylneuraminic acid mutarotase
VLGAAAIVGVAAGSWAIARKDNNGPTVEVVGSSSPTSIAPPTPSTAVPATTVAPTTVPLPGAGSWATMAAAPVEGRSGHSAVWTGTEMIVWGGTAHPTSNDPPHLADGAAYDPAMDSWRIIAPAPIAPRREHVAVWTGREMLVVGGRKGFGPAEAVFDGAAYDPLVDTWRTLAAPPGPLGLYPAAVWTGSDLLLWGGERPSDDPLGEFSNRGYAYDPEADSWREIADGPLSPRSAAAGVWSGEEVLIYGGGARYEVPEEARFSETYADLAAYDPATDSWRRLTSRLDGYPSVPEFAAWRGTSLFVWYADSYAGQYFSIYDPGGDTWSDFADRPPFEHNSEVAATAWTGTGFVFWGGFQGEGANSSWNDGAVFDSSRGSWERLAAVELTPRMELAGVWTGSEFIVWGGSAQRDTAQGRVYYAAADGARWRP